MATYNQIKKRLAKNNGIKEAPEKSDASFFERAWDTVLDLGTNVVAGGSQAVEGVIDAGLGIAGLFAGKDKKQEYAERIMNDWTGKHILDPMEKHTTDSYLNNNKIGETVENVAQGVGQMLPSVALSAIPYVGKALSMTSLFMRGVGSGMQESLSEGATYNQAFGYGALSGSVELLTEGISAKLFGVNAVDKGYGIKEKLGKALFKSEKSGLLKLAQDVAGEGLEEGISEFVNPLLKLTYKSLNETDFLSSEHIQRSIDSAVVGGLTSLVFKGTVGQLPAIKNSSKLADLQDQIIEYNDLSGKFYEDATSGKISAEEFSETEKQFNIRRNQIETEMSKILQEFGDATRQKILNRNAFLGQRFNSDGSVVQQGSNGTDLGVRAYNRDAYSVLDVNKEDSFVYKPSQTLSESAQETKQMIAQLSKAKGQPISYVFTDELNVKEKGGYKDGVIYINNRLQGSEMMTEVLKHEFTHSLENTKAYRQYSLFVLKTLLNNSTIATQLGIDVNADLKRLYDIYSKHGEINSFDPEIKQANILLSEIVAKYSSEKLFTDQESINRICQTNPNLAQRIIRWIKDTIARFSGKTKAERETIAFLRKAERMYTGAIENARIDNGKNLQYSIDNKNARKIKGVNEDAVPLDLQDALIEYMENEQQLNSKAINESILRKQENIQKAKEKKASQEIIQSLQNQLKELENEKQRQSAINREGAKNETSRRNVNNSENAEWEVDNTYAQRIFAISEEYELNNDKDAIELLVGAIKNSGLYKAYKTNKMFVYTKDMPETMQIIDSNILPKELRSIINENFELGIRSWFYLKDPEDDMFGFLSPDGEANRIFVALDSEDPNYVGILRHERTHYFQRHFKGEYNKFVEEIRKITPKEELETIYKKYKPYEEYYKKVGVSPQNVEARVWDEVFAEIYSFHQPIKNVNGLHEAIQNLEKSIAGKVNKKDGFKFSLETDSEGNQLTEAQAEFFKDSKVRDAEGNLLKCYHSTNKEFFVFDRKKIGSATDDGIWGTGFYFSNRYNDLYGDKVYEVYLNIRKPLILNEFKSVREISEHLDVVEDNFTLRDGLIHFNQMQTRQITSHIQDLGYDGIIVELSPEWTEIIAFGPNQIKSADNKKPTMSQDIRFSLREDNTGKELSKEQVDFFKDSKIRVKEVDGWAETIADDGQLFEVYHGTNSDEFYEFDGKSIGSANDMGWYGRGFYFAFSESEARYYGDRIMKCYLNIKNPFFFTEEMQRFDGVKDGSVSFDFASFVLNMAEKFPDIAKTLKTDYSLGYNNYGESDVAEINFIDLAEKIKEFYYGNRFDIVKFSSGEKEYFKYVVRTDLDSLELEPEIKTLIKDKRINSDYMAELTYNRKEITKEQYDKLFDVFEKYSKNDLSDKYLWMQYDSKQEAQKEKLSAVIEYIRDQVYRDFDMHMPEYYMQYIGEEFRRELIKQGYDGVVQSRTGDEVVAFYENQIKLSSNKKPTDSKDIRYSLDDDIWDEIFDASEEQVDDKVVLEQGKRTADEIKLRAKLKQSKVYSKEELRQLVSDAIGETPLTLKGKTREEVVSALFERMNTQDKFGKEETAEKIADYIIKNSQIDNFDYESVISAQASRNKILKYLHGIYLNREVKAEIRHLFGKAGDGIILAWGNKEGVEPFTVREELISDGVIISKESMNDADIFMDIYNAYVDSRDTMQHLKETAKMYATEFLTEEELKSFKQALSEQILNAYNEKGSETQISKLLDNNNKIIKKLTKRILDTRAYAKSYVDFMTIQKKAKELLNKKYSASILEDEKMKAFLKVVSKATNIKTISKNARDYVRSLAEVYNKENHVFNITTEDDNLGNVISSPSDFDQNLADMIDYIATGEGALTTQDLQIFTKITAGIIHLYKNYDAVIKNGVAVKTEDLAVRYIGELQEANKIRNSKGLLKLIWKIRQAIDPHAVFRNMDGYKVKFNKDLGINEDVGFFSEAYKEITDGEVKSAVAELELLKDFEEFFKNNKTFKKDLTKKMLKLKCKQVEGDKVHDTAEIEVSLDEAIAIYLTEQRPQANFYNTTIVLENKKGELVKYEVHKKDFDEFAKQFSVLEKQYIKLVKDFFNVKAKNLKVETDNSLYGYTNIEEGDTYYPIKRESYSIAKNIGDEPNVSEVLTLWNLSFNKEVRKNAKLPLRINGVQTTIQNHARAMSLYYGLAIPLRNFNRVYNKSIKYSKHPISIRQITGEKMRGGEEYIRKLFNDLQGIRNDYSIGSKILRKARGLYAQYQLGFNLKTVMGQTSSYLMGVNYLDADSLAKGLTVKTKKADLLRYNKFARFRIEDKTIVKAEGVIDKVSKIGDIATKPIQWMDNNVVLKLWGACQVQIEKNTGYRVGTQDNLERAGKLLEVVVRETQSNSIMTEKTGLSRHQNELIASMTMFSSDAQKQLSRIIDGLGYKLATQERVKAGLISKNSQEYKTASKQWIRATSGFILSSTMYVLIGMLFKWLLGKRDEEESLPEEFMGDFASQVAGLIPIFRDVYGYFENDYEINNYAFSMVNDMLSAVKDMWGLVDGIISGKELSKQDIAKPIRTSLYAIGMGTGMPVRNVYNYVYGLTSKFLPATAYKMNSLFYAPKVKDLDSAIENGNEKQSLAVVKELYQSRNLKLNDAYYNETLRLYKQGENIIPGKISETISYNGETFELEEKQHKQLIEVTNNSLIYISDTLNDKTYNNLTDKEKASYINNLYKINYVTNLLDIIGADKLSENETKKYLFAKCFSKDNDMLKHMAYVISMNSDKDKNGNTIYNSRKNKIVKYINSLKVSSAEKYLLMACAGFKNKNGEQQVKSYISKKGLSREERDKIMEYCGY